MLPHVVIPAQLPKPPKYTTNSKIYFGGYYGRDRQD
jgi:hypothetical protein